MEELAASGACDVLRYEAFRDGQSMRLRGNLLHHCCSTPWKLYMCRWNKDHRPIHTVIKIIQQVPQSEINALTEPVGRRGRKKSARALAVLAFRGDVNRMIIEALLERGVDPLQDLGGGWTPLFMVNEPWSMGIGTDYPESFRLDHTFLLVSSRIVVDQIASTRRVETAIAE